MSTKKKRPQTEPVEEFYIVSARDVACDLYDMKETCGWYPDGDAALAEAAVTASDDGDGFPQVVYRVQKYVEVK